MKCLEPTVFTSGPHRVAHASPVFQKHEGEIISRPYLSENLGFPQMLQQQTPWDLLTKAVHVPCIV